MHTVRNMQTQLDTTLRYIAHLVLFLAILVTPLVLRHSLLSDVHVMVRLPIVLATLVTLLVLYRVLHRILLSFIYTLIIGILYTILCVIILVHPPRWVSKSIDKNMLIGHDP